VTGWEHKNKDLEPYIKAMGANVPRSTIVAYQTRKDCIDELNAYLKEVLKNGSIN
jgi:hypothetical protein